MENHISLPPDSDDQRPTPSMLDAALAYARRGWAVLPIHTVTHGQCSCGNTTCDSPAKHPRTAHGVHDATSDETSICRWWTRWPEANIGIATGAVSGLVALDVDTRHDGPESLQQLIQAHPTDFPETVRSLSGGGGSHLIFASPGQPISNKVGLMPGIDIRGDGGYIVAPPSLHASGNRYAWDPIDHPDAMALAPMPDWLLALVIAPATPRSLVPSPDVGPPL